MAQARFSVINAGLSLWMREINGRRGEESVPLSLKPADLRDGGGGTAAQDTRLKTHFLVSRQSEAPVQAARTRRSQQTGEKTVGRYLGCIPALASTSTDQMLYARQSPVPHALILEICNKLLIISKVLFPLTVHKVT